MANYAIGSIGYDTTFELNEFNEPRIRSEIETLKDVLLFVLFAKKGQYPSLPLVGMNLSSYLYEFYDEIDESRLEAEIIEQCAMLGTYINSGEIMIKKIKYRKQPSLIIHIEGTETYPASYKRDSVNEKNQYMIGITYDDLNKMIYSVNS